MTDLDTRLQALATHRSEQVPEYSPPEHDEDTLETPVGWAHRWRSVRLVLLFAGMIVVVGIGGFFALRSIGGADAPDLEVGRSGIAMSDRTVVTRDDWSRPLTDSGREGTFVLAQTGGGSDTIQVAVPERATEPFRPASTFKILNALIILETNTLPDVDTVIPWDGVTREFEVWNQDHSLRTAMEASAVWVFQDLARQVGEERMAELVAAAAYGNAATGDSIDTFWLEGELRTSAIDQLDFLEGLALDQLPFDPDHQAAVRDILVVEEGPGWSIHYKTGTALRSDSALGWLVGIVDTQESQWVFAYNVDLPPLDVGSDLPSARDRLELVIELLESAGVITT